MIIIKFQNGTEWFKANWVFRQFAADVIAVSENDVDVVDVISKAAAFGTLRLDAIDRNLADRVISYLKLISEETLRGSISGWQGSHPDDKAGQRQYNDSMVELLELIHKASGDH